MEEILSLLIGGAVGFVPVVILFFCREINYRKRHGKTKNEIRDEAYRNGKGWKY